MGCQASKGANSPQKAPVPHSPAKTLLHDAAHQKAAASTSAVLASTPSTSGHGEGMPLASSASSQMSAGIASTENGVPTNSVHSLGSSRGLLRKHRTLCTSKKELDIMVVEFSSHDSTVGSVLGRNCKEMRWKVMYDRDADPIDIKLHVQEHKLHSNEVEIECNGQPIFHGAGAHAKAKMTEDFRYQWSFRGTIQGINELNYFHVNPTHSSNGGETWFPATITGQREDGFFEVRAQEADMNGLIREVKYPAVSKDHLREAASQKPLAVPENCLTLEVPKNDPLRAVLSLDNGELVTHHFGKPSPSLAPMEKKPEIAVKVSQDRSELTATVGHQVLSHFVSGEVQAISNEVERLRRSWTVQAGPFAKHTIEIAKRHTLGKIITLLVDGQVLVESTGADIGCAGNDWQCKFRLVGERVLDFEVYKTNGDGGALNETGHVLQRRKYVHECYVTIPNDWDFSHARLFIDAIPFTELEMEAQRYAEPNLTTGPMALMHNYGITTPYMVDRNAPSNMMLLASQVFAKANEGRKTAGGWFDGFGFSCNADSVGDGNTGKDALVIAEHM